MVEFLKAKPTSFVNQPVGVVGVDMGGQRAGQVLASTANNLAQQFFKEATDNEKKLGEDAALELPIRDTQGNLQFTSIDKSLSQVAQEAADPVVRRRYTEALGVDLYKRINEIRLDSTSSEDFNSKTQAFMGSYIDEVNKLGGAEYQNVITQSVTNLSTQHFYAMATEERKEQLRVASLNALAINQKSTADMAASARQDIKLNPNNILDIFETYEANVNLLAIQNDENLKTNNLNPAKHSAQDKVIRSALAIAAVKYVAQSATYNEILQIQEHLAIGKPLDPKVFGNKIDSKGFKDLMGYINDSPYKEQILKEVEALGVLRGKKESNDKAVESYNDKKDLEVIQELMRKPENKIAALNYESDINQQSNSIFKEWKNNNFVVNDKTVNALKDMTNNIMKATDLKSGGLKHNGKQIFLNQKGANALIRQTTGNFFVNHIVASGKFTNVEDMNELRNALVNRDENNQPNLASLNTEQKAVIEQMKPLIDSLDVSSNVVYNGINKVFTARKEILKQVTANQNKTNANKVIVTGAFTGGFGKNTTAKGKVLDDAFQIQPDYFDNNFLNDLAGDGEASTKARQIDLTIANGAHTNTFKNFIERATSGRSNDNTVTTAINMHKRYSTYNSGGVEIDVLDGTLDAKDHAILTLASNLIPNYKNADDFFGVANPTPSSMMTKIVEAFNNKDDVESKQRLKNIIGAGNNSYQYLISLGFDPREAQNMQFLPQLAASLNLSKDKTNTLLENMKDNLYVHGEGLIVDTLSSGNNSLKSKFSMLRVFNDPVSGEEDRARIRDYINKDLSALQVTNKLGEIEGSYKLNYVEQVMTGGTEVGMGITLGGTRKRPLGAKGESETFDDDDKKVFLHPYGDTSDIKNLKYAAVVRVGNSFRMLQTPDKGVLMYDTKELRLMLDQMKLEKSGD